MSAGDRRDALRVSALETKRLRGDLSPATRAGTRGGAARVAGFAALALRSRVALVTALVYLATSLPYGYGYLRQTASERFTGIVFDVVDTAQYFAWMRAFAHAPLIANPLTPEEGAARFFNLQWWLLGVLAFDTPLGPLLTYELLRIGALVAFAALLWRFCRRVLPEPGQAFLAFCIVMLGSGLGWLLVVLKQVTGELHWPLAVQVAEANTWFSAMAFPHLLAASALMLAIYLGFLAHDGPHARRWLIALVPLTLALGFSHGYDLLPTMAVPGATAALLTLRERRLSSWTLPAAVVVAAASVPALYVLSLTRLDPTWEGVLRQYGNAGVYTPPPPLLVVLLGLPLLLALPRLRPSEWRDATVPALFVRVWCVVGFALLYIPTDYQIKMLTGYQIPLGILAAQTVAGWRMPAWRGMPAGARRLSPALLVILAVVLTNLYLTGWRVIDLRRADYPYYLTGDDVAALEAVGDVAGEGDVVLSSPELGVFVPVYADARPYVAHWAQTLRFFERRDQARWFFAPGTGDADRATFLAEQGIAFVIAGPAEDRLAAGNGGPLALEVVRDGTTRLYRAGDGRGVLP